MEKSIAFKKLKDLIDYDDIEKLIGGSYLQELYELLNQHYNELDIIIEESASYLIFLNIATENNVNDYIANLTHNFIQKYKINQI